MDGAAWLVGGEADLDTAMRHHFARLATLFQDRADLIFSVDNLCLPDL